MKLQREINLKVNELVLIGRIELVLIGKIELIVIIKLKRNIKVKVSMKLNVNTINIVLIINKKEIKINA